MELIVVVAALCIVGALAMRFGYDSRMPAHSKEQDQANFGLSWEEQTGASPGDARARSRVRAIRPIQRSDGSALYRADRLQKGKRTMIDSQHATHVSTVANATESARTGIRVVSTSTLE